jgi:nucleotide-binding universal stress UspA family protein
MFKHILVPLDQSALSEKVLGIATALAIATKAKVTLLHIISTTSYAFVAAPMSEETYQMLVDSETLNATDYLKKVQQRLHDCGVADVEIDVEIDGTTSLTIGDTARSCDLVVMSTHGRSGLVRTVLGSIANEVVHSVDIPVLLVSARQQIAETAGCAPSFHRILVPLDGSPLAAQALPIASALAQVEGAELVLLSAMPETVLEGAELATPNPPWAKRALHDAAHKVLPANISYEVVVTGGEAAEAIVREAVERDCDLIVMTTHGRSGFARLRFGSIADAVLAHTPVPLLLLHSRGVDEEN